MSLGRTIFLTRDKTMTPNSEFSKYPNLQKYLSHFYENKGTPEHRGYLPNLILWVELLTAEFEIENNITEIDSKHIDIASFFEMAEDDADEFHSWGHSSRWKNVFWPFAECNQEIMERKCLKLASLRGDPDVDEIILKDEAAHGNA